MRMTLNNRWATGARASLALGVLGVMLCACASPGAGAAGAKKADVSISLDDDDVPKARARDAQPKKADTTEAQAPDDPAMTRAAQQLQDLLSKQGQPASRALGAPRASAPDGAQTTKARAPQVFEVPPPPQDEPIAPVVIAAPASAPVTEPAPAPLPAAPEPASRAPVVAPSPVPAAPASAGTATKPASTGFRIATARLATRVESFGRFTAMDASRVARGRATPVLLYSELDGFAHRTQAGLPPPPAEAGVIDDGSTQWTISIAQRVELYSADGRLVQLIPEQVVKDLAMRRRRDHYLVQRLTLPPTLSAGGYTLKVVATDQATGQTDEANVTFTVVER